MLRPAKFITALAALVFLLFTCLLITAPPAYPLSDDNPSSFYHNRFRSRRPISCGVTKNRYSRSIAQTGSSHITTTAPPSRPTTSNRHVAIRNPPLFKIPGAAARGSTLSTHSSTSTAESRYLMYVPYAGVTNQLISIWHASMIAKALNRTLLLPNLSPNVHVQVDGEQAPAPTRWSEFIDLDLYSERTGLQVEELDDFLARRGIVEHTEERIVLSKRMSDHSPSHSSKQNQADDKDGATKSSTTKSKSRPNSHKKKWVYNALTQTSRRVAASSSSSAEDRTVSKSGLGVEGVEASSVTIESASHRQRSLGSRFVQHPVVEQCYSEAGYGTDRRIDMTGRQFMQRYRINSTLIPTPFLDPERDDSSLWARLRMDKVIERYQQPKYQQQEVICLGHVYRLLPGGNNRAWFEFGQHFHFTEQVHQFVDEILDTLLPPNRQSFVGVHLRRAALASMNADLPVLVLTNERDPYELAKADAKKWIRVDHAKLGTFERFGRYGPILIDGALLARANLLVGVEYSTYFRTASKRAESWYGGKTIFVT
ncbi:hypothetical protein BGZ94_001668 [Podila epigama]|nr:hypothetical protein BGZ94_001668 [Podila epigama]